MTYEQHIKLPEYIRTGFLLLVLMFALFRAHPVEAATLFLLPSQSAVGQDDTFFVEVRLDTEDDDINAVEVNVLFPQTYLEVVELGRGGSILTLWPREPAFSNAEGTLSFSGGTHTGFSGPDGLVGRILFRAKELNDATVVTFQNSSQVLLADGKGTPAVLKTLPSRVAVLPSTPPGIIASPSHPDPLQWFKEKTLVLKWETAPKTQWSYLLTQDLTQEPDEIPDLPTGDIKFENLEDGIYYFSLREIVQNEVASTEEPESDAEQGRVFRYRAMIDATPPEPFEVWPQEGDAQSRGYPFLAFNTKDATSGIRSYALCTQEVTGGSKDTVIDQNTYGVCREVIPPVILTAREQATMQLSVRVFDRAGNVRQVMVALTETTRPSGFAPLLLAAVLFLLLVTALSRIPRIRSATRALFGKSQ